MYPTKDSLSILCILRLSAGMGNSSPTSKAMSSPLSSSPICLRASSTQPTESVGRMNRASLARNDVQIGLDEFFRIPTHHDFKYTGLDNSLLIAVEEREILGTQRKLHRPRLTGRETDPLKSE